MQRVKQHTEVDLQVEQQAVVAWLKNHWPHPDMYEALVPFLLRHTIQTFGATFSQWTLSDELHAKQDAITELLGDSDKAFYDARYQTFCALPSSIWHLAGLAETTALQTKPDFYGISLEAFPALAQLTPDVTMTGQPESFEGHDTTSYRTANFTDLVSFENVVNRVGYGTTPGQTLVNALVGHFAQLLQYNNTIQLQQALAQCDFQEQSPRMLFEIQPTSTHHLAKAVLLQTQQSVDNLQLEVSYREAQTATPATDEELLALQDTLLEEISQQPEPALDAVAIAQYMHCFEQHIAAALALIPIPNTVEPAPHG